MNQETMKFSKRQKVTKDLVERNKAYPATEAMNLLKKAATAKFLGTGSAYTPQ